MTAVDDRARPSPRSRRIPRATALLLILLQPTTGCGDSAATAAGNDVGALREQLGAPSSTARRVAIASLSRLGPAAGAAVGDLQEVLREDPELRLREAAAGALGSIGDRAARGALAAAVDDGALSLVARRAATRELATLEPSATLDRLLRRGAERPADVVYAVVDDGVWQALPDGSGRADLLLAVAPLAGPTEQRLTTALAQRAAELGPAARSLTPLLTGPAAAQIAPSARARALGAIGGEAALQACAAAASRAAAGRAEPWIAALRSLGEDPALAPTAAAAVWQTVAAAEDRLDRVAGLEALGAGLAAHLEADTVGALTGLSRDAVHPPLRRAALAALRATPDPAATVRQVMPAAGPAADPAEIHRGLRLLTDLSRDGGVWPAIVDREISDWWQRRSAAEPSTGGLDAELLDALWELGGRLTGSLRADLLERPELPSLARRTRAWIDETHPDAATLAALLARPLAAPAPAAERLADLPEGVARLRELVVSGPAAVRADCLRAALRAGTRLILLPMAIDDQQLSVRPLPWPELRAQRAGDAPAGQVLLYLADRALDLRNARQDSDRPVVWLDADLRVLADESAGDPPPSRARAALVLRSGAPLPEPGTSLRSPLTATDWSGLRR